MFLFCGQVLIRDIMLETGSANGSEALPASGLRHNLLPACPLVASQASIGFMHLELNKKDARLNSKMTAVTFLAFFFVVGDAILETEKSRC